jgi:hypothetical protein
VDGWVERAGEMLAEFAAGPWRERALEIIAAGGV